MKAKGFCQKTYREYFEKGFTSTVQKDHGATGMGLYLAKQAAESLHIQIKVESQHTVGTSFMLIFPKRNEIAELWTSY